MRPYLAIIKDSFRAAMATRVLYVLILLITLLLLAIAPLHLRETLDWRLSSDVNVQNPGQMVRRVVDGRETKKPIARIWDLLPEKIRDKVLKSVEPADDDSEQDDVPGGPPPAIEDMLVQEKLIDELNTIISNPEFYREEDWVDRVLPSEAEELIELGVENLSLIRNKRLNRLLVATALAPAIDKGNASALTIYYAVWEFPIPINQTHQQFAQLLTSSVPWVSIPWYFEKLVLSIGLLIAIIVTANMIPDMFEPGSLNLLLSKPISRWGLFVSKFFGGCAFIALCATYLFCGLWLWMGIGMGVWDRAMLLSIPLYVIVFAIYFAVSAVVGLVWRSPIVSVILTLLFWAFCFSIGSAFSPFDRKMKNSELVALLPVNDQVFSADILHRLKAWDGNDQAWQSAFDSNMTEQVEIQFAVNSFMFSLREVPAFPGILNFLEPIYDKSNSQLISSSYEFGKSLSSGKKRMFVAKVDDGGKPEFRDVGFFPIDAVRAFATDKGVIVASSDGSFYRLDQAKLDQLFAKAKSKNLPEEEAQVDKNADNPATAQAQDKELSRQTAAAEEADESQEQLEVFQPLGPENGLAIRSSKHVDYNHLRDEIAVYRRGQLKIFKSEDSSTANETDDPKPSYSYQQHAVLDLDLGFSEAMTCRIAYQGDTIALAFGNGQVITVDAETVTEKKEYQPENRTAIEEIRGSADGRYFATLYRNGNLWLLDTQSDEQMKKADIIGQGEVCAFTFDDENQLWVCDNTDRATEYDLASGEMKVRYSPPGGWIEKLYRYGLRPFYKICPKPGEFYKVVSYLSASGDSEANADVDLNKTFEVSDPWSPLWSGLLFMLSMLFLGCLVFQFRDY